MLEKSCKNCQYNGEQKIFGSHCTGCGEGLFNHVIKEESAMCEANSNAVSAEVRKPPSGIIPEYYYERGRIQDLARAIHEYAGDCRQGENLIVWADELKERILKWNRLTGKS